MPRYNNKETEKKEEGFDFEIFSPKSEEQPVVPPVKKASLKLTIERVEKTFIFAVDEKGNGYRLEITKELSNKKVGDVIEN